MSIFGASTFFNQNPPLKCLFESNSDWKKSRWDWITKISLIFAIRQFAKSSILLVQIFFTPTPKRWIYIFLQENVFAKISFLRALKIFPVDSSLCYIRTMLLYYWDDKMSIIVSLQKNVGSIIFSHPKEGKKPDFLHNCRSKFSLKNKWLAESGNLNCDHRNRSLLISLVFTKEIKITITIK